MPTTASPARLLANQANAALSTGPKTLEGKARSRGNALKHGLTGGGVVLPVEDLAEVERRSAAFQAELAPEGEVGHALARRAAILSVRMERGAEQETAALSERVRLAMDEFEAPEGVNAIDADRLRVEAGRRAMFDPSREATLARKYEAAAERGFFRALKELRQLRREPARALASDVAAEAQASLDRLGSFLPVGAPIRSTPPQATPTPPPAPSKAPSTTWDPFASSHFDVPISIGRAR
jgi:hypothetical protein